MVVVGIAIDVVVSDADQFDVAAATDDQARIGSAVAGRLVGGGVTIDDPLAHDGGGAQRAVVAAGLGFVIQEEGYQLAGWIGRQTPEPATKGHR